MEGDAAGWAAVTCAGYRYRAQDTDPVLLLPQSPSRVWSVRSQATCGTTTACPGSMYAGVACWLECGNIPTAGTATATITHQQVDTQEAFLSLCSRH